MRTTLTFLGCFFIYSVTQAQVFIHPFAEQDENQVLKYRMNDDKEVIPAGMTYVFERTATPRMKDGPYDVIDRDANGRIRMTATMPQPDPIATSFIEEKVEYYASGDTASYTRYFEGADRLEKTLHENGQLKSIGKYGQEGRSGLWVTYHDNGSVQDSGIYAQGQKAGEWFAFYPNGQLKSRILFEKGLESGESESFYQNGVLRESVIYVAGKKEGVYKSLYADGKTALEGAYMQGAQEGAWIEYSKSGQRKRTYEFDQGQLKGPYTMRDANGDTLIDGKVVDGLFSGLTRAYHPDGVLASELLFQRGVVVKRTSWHPNGEVRIQAKGSPKGLVGQCYDVLGEPVECVLELERSPTGQQGMDTQLSDRLSLRRVDGYTAYGVYAFEVDEAGSVRNVEVVESANPDYDREVMTKLGELSWDAGYFDGKPVTYRNQVSLHVSSAKDVRLRFGHFYLADSAMLAQMYLVDPLWATRSKGPQFQGGEGALLTFLSESMSFPEKARDAGIEGTCYVQFGVEPSGLISSAEVLKGVHPLLDYAAIDLVNEMPAWEAGVQDGEKVKVYYKLPLRFTLR